MPSDLTLEKSKVVERLGAVETSVAVLGTKMEGMEAAQYKGQQVQTANALSIDNSVKDLMTKIDVYIHGNGSDGFEKRVDRLEHKDLTPREWNKKYPMSYTQVHQCKDKSIKVCTVF